MSDGQDDAAFEKIRRQDRRRRQVPKRRPKPKAVGRCPRTGKVKHRTAAAAAAVMAAMLATNNPRHGTLNVYACPHCSEWHVGHSSRRD